MSSIINKSRHHLQYLTHFQQEKQICYTITFLNAMKCALMTDMCRQKKPKETHLSKKNYTISVTRQKCVSQ
jgi:hypothetical protein